MGNVILNIAGGKIQPIPFPGFKEKLYSEEDSVLNLDQMYLDPVGIQEILDTHYRFISCLPNSKFNCNCNLDIYDFLERYHILFDGISIYRFLEHVPKTKVLYFIYLLSTSIKLGGYIDIIVPDCKKLAQRIISEKVFSPSFEAEDIITTFELLNEPACPHCSLWSDERLVYFFGLEERFTIEFIKKDYEFDGRDIYIRALAKRIK